MFDSKMAWSLRRRKKPRLAETQRLAFVDGAKDLIRKDAHVNGAFYVCPVFNELILGQKRVGVRALELAQYHPVKNERQATREELLSGDVL
jgi:hypothetical protein